MNKVNENKAIETVMTNIGVLPPPNNNYSSQNLVNPSSASYNKNLTMNQQGPTTND